MALRDQVSHDQGKLGPTGRPGLAEPRSAHQRAGPFPGRPVSEGRYRTRRKGLVSRLLRTSHARLRELIAH
jgi:hypothetical protein